jgi:hypothetical protein
MKKKLLYILLAIALFFMGLLFHELIPKEQTKISGYDKDFTYQNDTTIDYSKILRGRFLIGEADCAGLEFFSKDKIIWRNEIGCNWPDTFRLFWLNKQTFVYKDTDTMLLKKGSPPRMWINKIVYFKNDTLIVHDLWTGWGDYKTWVNVFRRYKE